MKQRYLKSKFIKQLFSHFIFYSFLTLVVQGCGIFSGYSNESLYHDDVKTIYVKMFDNQTLRRNVEYELSEALAKRIEAQTPYKIVSNQDYADTVISGQIQSIGEFALSFERQTGHVLEKEVQVRAVVNWKNLKTGELLIDNKSIGASASYSDYQQQDFLYGSNLTANNLARNIVELMEKKW
jgi:hypothetical protein